MSSEPLVEILDALRDQIPGALHPVLAAFSKESEDAPEQAWRRLIEETLHEG